MKKQTKSTCLQFYACILPKVGCTNWLRFIRSLHLPPDELRTFDAHPYRRESFDRYGLHFRNTATGGTSESRAAETVLNNGRRLRRPRTTIHDAQRTSSGSPWCGIPGSG